MATSMRDVAQLASVSKATVSRVLNKARYVDTETRQRVLKAVSQLNYYKNVHARRLVSGGNDLFGLVISEIANPFFPEVIRGFEAAALEKGLEILLFNTEYGPQRIHAAVRKMIENRVRAAAVMSSMIDEAHVNELASHQIATVLLDQDCPQRFVSCIQIDYAGGASQAVDHLWELGHRRFAFVAGPGNIKSAQTFRHAVVEVLQRRRAPCEVLEGNHRVEGGAAAARLLLEEPIRPTAVLCGNDLTAIGLMNALEGAGLRVPRDVSVVGFDDIYSAHLTRPPLTTVRIPREGLGKLSFEILDKTLRSKRKRGAIYTCETSLVVRGSTGPAEPQRQTPRRRR
jgi:DNA-binding LacI/PurR family transcriptional regulator